MRVAKSKSEQSRSIMELVRRRIERGGDRPWRFADFADLSPAAVAQALSRLARTGAIERLSKGIYYRGRKTAFGRSRPNPAVIRNLASQRTPIFPAGIAAANMLGLTTQIAARPELATTGSSVPRKLVGENTIVHTRRPEAWSALSDREAALLDVLRRAGRTSELSPDVTIRKILALLSEGDCFRRLQKVAGSEPPRVRAILGALGEQLGADTRLLKLLRASLNPISRFAFGLFTELPSAQNWQAKGMS